MEYAFTNHQRPTIEHIHLLKSLGITSYDPWVSNISLICDVLQLPEAEVDERAREFTKDGRGGSISEALCEFLYEEFLDAQEAADVLGVKVADFEALVEGGHVIATGSSVLVYPSQSSAEHEVKYPAAQFANDGKLFPHVKKVADVLRRGGMDEENIFAWLFDAREELGLFAYAHLLGTSDAHLIFVLSEAHAATRKTLESKALKAYARDIRCENVTRLDMLGILTRRTDIEQRLQELIYAPKYNSWNDKKYNALAKSLGVPDGVLYARERYNMTRPSNTTTRSAASVSMALHATPEELEAMRQKREIIAYPTVDVYSRQLEWEYPTAQFKTENEIDTFLIELFNFLTENTYYEDKEALNLLTTPTLAFSLVTPAEYAAVSHDHENAMLNAFI